MNHKILIEKLEIAGIRGVSLALLTSYLSRRTQLVKIKGTTSASLPLTIGIPQGSCLGPLMFLIYFNDANKLNLRGSLYLYADDSAIFYKSKTVSANVESMKLDLSLLSEFFRLNRLTLNVEKSNVMHFHSKRKRIIDVPTVYYNGVEIKEVDTMTYLGLALDKHRVDPARFLEHLLDAFDLPHHAV